MESWKPIRARVSMKTLGFGEVHALIVCQSSVFERDTISWVFDNIPNIGGSDDQRIVEELQRTNFQHAQDDLRVFGIILVTAVV